MNQDARDIEGPGGPLRLRAAAPADEGFQYALFCARRAGVFRLAGLPAPAIETMLRQQYLARARGYRTTYPAARWLIVECAGEPIGELVLDEGAEAAHIVDIALHLEWQGRGIGPALVRAVMRESAARGGVRAMADVGNAPSRKMFARLGFVERLCEDGANVEVVWRPGAS
jgi:ribosomal protein S18 acetylase RimI-like enzyme